MTGGADTRIWRVEHENRLYALRVFPAGRTVDREIAAMTTATTAGIPAPHIYRQGIWENRTVLLLSWMTGQTLASQLQSSPWQTWRLGAAFGQLQAAVHGVFHNSDPTAWIEWLGPREPLLKERLYALEPRRMALIHLDYHPLNVMTDGAHITCVLDWTNAAAGDPRADFARTYTILRVEPWSPAALPPYIRLFRWTLERAWRHGYRSAGGELNDMALFYAWAGAVMIRDLSPRIGRAGFWLQAHHLDSVRRWTDRWKARAGLPTE